MTDCLSAFSALAQLHGNYEHDQVCEAAIDRFYTELAVGDQLVLDKWFAVQAMADRSDVVGNVRRLMEHRDFDLENPNRVRSLISSLSSNPGHFHKISSER